MAKKIAIVLQTPRDQHSSVLLTYSALSAELMRRGHAVSVFTPEDFPGARRFPGRLAPFVYPIAVARWMRRHRAAVDTVVFHSYAGWLAEATGATGDAVVIVSFHGIEPMYHRALMMETSGRLSRRYRFLQERVMPMFLKTACRKAARVTCLNREERRFLIDNGYADANHVVTVAHSVHDRFFLALRSPRPVRTLLFVAQWLPIKGIDALRTAFTALARRHADLRLICAGTLAAAADVTAAFPDDVRERVMVVPRVDQPRLADIYRDADLFVFPSSYEGFGVAVLEAMAAALPIVATATGVAGDALVDRESAMLVPPRDAAAIVHAIDALIADAGLRARVSAGARAAAEAYREAARVGEWADALTVINRVS
ncbi:MAG TPA: glycosyltransferase family 4 protein [Vicinamibacterales bacterium]|nr:glycosyltransferase family 4 protein [Vicinamibacterales bacterium]